MKKFILFVLSVLAIAGIVAVYFFFISSDRRKNGTTFVIPFIRNAEAHQDWVVEALSTCNDAPFAMPTRGLIGYLWNDAFKIGHHHQGIDIFAGTDIGITPVYAAYDGYLSRQSEWKSTVVIRIPSDPLQPGRQIWTYYTHLAGPDGTPLIAADFPPGTTEVFVKAGTLLGYQGNYSGDPLNPVGVHLHFSIIKDNGSGQYLNELEIANTIDPSPYLGLPLNKNDRPTFPIKCEIRTN
ncbi:MAG: M23 family metallopeptidase [Anaerolineaceae bacterium]|nr:M23 family metallopeptidase [Anaerolineaceae bacterium]